MQLRSKIIFLVMVMLHNQRGGADEEADRLRRQWHDEQHRSMIASRKRRWEEEDAEEERLWKRQKQQLICSYAVFRFWHPRNHRQRRIACMKGTYHAGVLSRNTISAPWLQHLLNPGQDTTDANFKHEFGFDKEGFRQLNDLLMPGYHRYILYSAGTGLFRLAYKTNNRGKPRVVPCEMMTALVLVFLRTKGHLKHIQPLCGYCLTAVSDWIKFALVVICQDLERHPDCAFQKFPTAQEREIMQSAVRAKYDFLAGTFAFMDGCKLGIQKPPQDEQERWYNGWLHDHVANNVIVYSPGGDIIYAVCDFPGTAHDQAVFDCSHLSEILQAMDQDDGQTPNAHRHNIIADVGFTWHEHEDVPFDPRSKSIKGRMRRCLTVKECPPRQGVSEQLYQAQRAYEKIYFQQLTSARQSVEWGNGTWQKIFRD
jgi:hypothetical protein